MNNIPNKLADLRELDDNLPETENLLKEKDSPLYS